MRAGPEATVAPTPAAEEGHAPDVRRALRWTAVGVGVLWLPILVLWSGAPFAITFDDAYYYFEIAQRLAAGDGSSFDGLTSTNGYHPLWMTLCVPVYLLGLDGLAAVRVLLVAQLVFWVATLWVVAGLVARAAQGWPRLPAEGRARTARFATGAVVVVVAVLAANPYVFKLFVNGLESGPAAFVGALLLARVDRRGGRFVAGEARDRLVVGVLLAVAFWARTDAGVLIACVGAWTLPDWWSSGRRVRPAVELMGPPAVAMAGFFVLNQAVFGTWTQVSGEIKRLPLTPGRLMIIALAGVLVLALMAVVRHWRDAPVDDDGLLPARLPRVAAFVGRTAWYGAFCALLVTYYAVLSAQQWLWYFAPLALYVLVLAALLVADLAEGAAAEASGHEPARDPVRAMAPVLAIVLVPLVAGLAYQATEIADPDARSIQEANREAGEWISAEVPDDAVLGSWDAGVLGYFTEQPVVNLDGVVNDADYAEAGTPEERGALLEALDVGWIANHGPSVDGADPEIAADVERVLPGRGAGLQQVHAVPFTYSGTTTRDQHTGQKQMAVFVYRLPERG